MRKLLLGAAIGALILPAAAQASEGHEVCLDQGCQPVSLFGLQNAASEGGAFTGTEAIQYGTWGFDLEGRDLSVSPGDSFFRHANGTYLDNLVIPADRTRYGSFDLLRELSDNRLRALIDELNAVGDLAPGSDEAKIRDLYRSFMDTARADQLDAEPLAPMLADIRAVADHAQMAAYMGRTRALPGGSYWGAAIFDDAKNPEAYAVYLFQGGTGLPDRDYYLTDQYAPQKEAYRAYVAEMLGMIGWDDPAAAADAIVAMESQLAQAHWTRIESRDDDKTYNPMSVAELEAAAPGFDWRAYFTESGLGEVDRFIVYQNTAFPTMARVFAETPIEVLRAWQAFHTIDQAAPYLSQRFVDAQWRFRSHTLSGQPEQRSREKRGVSFAEGLMGEALGRLYVDRWFPAENKAAMEDLVADLRTALAIRIQQLDWMTPETQQRALEKLEKFTVKIGYPDRWRDYSGLEVRADDLFGNMVRASQFEWAYDLNRLNGPVDDEEWGMTPQTVNAYYSSTKNEIVFPAAILQPPFFDMDADPAVNYGGIGGVIGHEIGHGFDDQGRKSDGDGVLRDWWSPEDAAAFVAQTEILGAQYDAYEPLPGYNVQGGLTMGENIGDLAGVTLALEAYRLSLDGAEAPVLDGTTGDQRVFYGWAQVWRGKYRDAAMQRMVATDPHSPPEFRVIGPLRNIDAWYDAFDVQPGDAYYLAPEDRVRLW